MKKCRNILWSAVASVGALLCGCNGPDIPVPEPEIPAERIIAYTAKEKTAPFATGAFMARIQDNRFTPEGEGGSGEIIFESPVFAIGNIAFLNCTSLWSVEIPSEVTMIGKKAFEGCKSLRRVDILGDKIVTIGSEAFMNCESLEDITIPDEVVEIATHTFDGCKSLRNINFGTGVKDVYDKAFYGCESLEVLDIPANVIFLGNNCFEGAKSLKEVYVRGDRVLEIGYMAFAAAKSELKIYVPADLMDDYKKNIFWSTYVGNLHPLEN